MVIKINEKISEEAFDKVIAAINSLSSTNESKICVYLSSRGGSYNAMEGLLDLINCHQGIICLIGYGQILSCAFELFFRAECEKKLVGGACGMFHQSNISIDMNENMKPEYIEGEMQVKYMKGYMKSNTMELCRKLAFTANEFKRIKQAKDVWFGVERMEELLKVQKAKRIEDEQKIGIYSPK